MIIFVFGNQDLREDSLPLRILPKLQEKFPNIKFEVKDSNEDWDVPEELTVFDTVMGINGMKVFDDIKAFSAAPRVSMHDFDALTNIRYLIKLGKIKKIKVIGISPTMNESDATEAVAAVLKGMEFTHHQS
jgi:hypothetical protein